MAPKFKRKFLCFYFQIGFLHEGLLLKSFSGKKERLSMGEIEMETADF